jgi:selenocysteine lyase/cysteine desulfurase
MMARMADLPAPTRRTFLGAGLVGGVATLTGCTGEDSPPPGAAESASPSSPSAGSSEPPPPRYDDWAWVREQVPLDAALAQFAAFVLSPHTRPLEEAIAAFRDELAVDTEAALLKEVEREDAVRAGAADFAGGAPGQYALTDSTTMGLGLMYGGLRLTPDDEILTTTHDFYSTEESLRLLARRTGARVRRISLYDDPATATTEQIVERIMAGITSRTRVVALTWVHSSTGVRLPLREITEAMRRLSRVARDQYLVCVDGVHGFAAVDTDLPDLGVDFLAAGTHKWLFGPRGTGVLWGRDWEPLTQVIPTFSGPGGGAARLTPGGYHSFEHRWALADAFTFMGGVGRARAVERTVEQATRLKEGLADVDGITVVTPTAPEVSAGIVCLDVRGMPPANAVATLRTQGIVASATPYRVSYLRLGPSIATTPEQVDTAVAAITRLV